MATASDSAAIGRPAVAETHTGIVFFVGDRAYKLKKPVDFGFLDFRTRQARLDACRREVALNRRLAPDVYLGVANVAGPDGELCDHLVVMRRLPDDRRLATVVAGGSPVEGYLRLIAGQLAEFHRTAGTSPAVEAATASEANLGRWEANAVEMAPYVGPLLDSETAAEVITLARRYIAGRDPLFRRRIELGRARDGHGDLLADDIFCLDDGPRLLDCLEFDDELRAGDTLADAAFLAMDLERLGRPDLAALFLDAYAAAAGDHWPASLAHHYIGYRAQVRAKVACLRWAQGDEGSGQAARGLLRLCHRRLQAAAVRLVLVGGLPGTGKSTVAHGIAAPLGAQVFRSDIVRKELACADPHTHVAAPVGEGLYDQRVTDATYAELLSRAKATLGLGQSAVLDATWRDGRWRDEARRLADATGVDLIELRCQAPLAVTLERAARRYASGADPSDATPEVVRALSADDQPWPTATTVDTSGESDGAVAAALAAVGPMAGPTDAVGTGQPQS